MDISKYDIRLPSTPIDYGQSYLSQLPSFKPVLFIARFEEDEDAKLLKVLIFSICQSFRTIHNIQFTHNSIFDYLY